MEKICDIRKKYIFITYTYAVMIYYNVLNYNQRRNNCFKYK